MSNSIFMISLSVSQLETAANLAREINKLDKIVSAIYNVTTGDDIPVSVCICDIPGQPAFDMKSGLVVQMIQTQKDILEARLNELGLQLS